MSTTQNAINNLLAYTSLTSVPANSLLGNNTASPANAVGLTASQVLDLLGATQGDVLYRGASGWAVLAPGTSGQFLQTQGGSANPQWASASSNLPVTVVSGTSQTAAVNNSYIANNASLVTITLPPTAAVGGVVNVGGLGAGGWLIAQNSGQIIHFGNMATTSGTGGSVASQNQYDNITVQCVVANATWVVQASQGNMTVS